MEESEENKWKCCFYKLNIKIDVEKLQYVWAMNKWAYTRVDFGIEKKSSSLDDDVRSAQVLPLIL